MGTILKNIVQFTGLVVGVPTSLPHRLNVNGRPVAPKIGGADAGGFTITADTLNVTVVRSADAGAAVNVYVEHWHTVEDVVPKIPPPGMLIGLTPLFFAGGGGGGAASQLLSLYGDGSFGDHTTAGDERWTTDETEPPPGAPTVPTGSLIEAAFFNNLTISPGDTVTVGGLVSEPTKNAVVIFVKGTLTIGAGASINVNGGPGGGYLDSGGQGRKAIIGSEDGASGAAGVPPFNAGPGLPGGGGSRRPARTSALRVGGAGGGGGTSPVPGGAGGTDQADASWPYSLAQALSIGALLYAIGGGNGGGSGGCSASSGGGSGGGGAGTLVIFANNVVFADPGCLRAIGGPGGDGFSTENVAGGGGGGGTGGSILIVTEELTLAGISDVSGGAGGLGAGSPQNNGGVGGPGEAIGFNPTLLAQIPV